MDFVNIVVYTLISLVSTTSPIYPTISLSLSIFNSNFNFFSYFVIRESLEICLAVLIKIKFVRSRCSFSIVIPFCIVFIFWCLASHFLCFVVDFDFDFAIMGFDFGGCLFLGGCFPSGV